MMWLLFLLQLGVGNLGFLLCRFLIFFFVSLNWLVVAVVVVMWLYLLSLSPSLSLSLSLSSSIARFSWLERERGR